MPKAKITSTLTSYAAAFAQAIDASGADCKGLFKQAQLDNDALKNPNARYPDAALTTLVSAVSTKSNEDFGLRAAAFVTPTTLHALGFSVMASESLHAALLRLVRYFRIVSDGAIVTLESQKAGHLICIGFNHQGTIPAAWSDSALATVLMVCRWLHGPEFVPLKVQLQRKAPRNSAPFTAFFGAPIEFQAAHNGLLLDSDLVTRQLPTSNAELAYQNDKIVADYLARFDTSRLSERVRTIFIERLVTGKFSEEQTAEQLNLSLRSLQRRLRDEQTSYQQLLDETRLDLALQYINRTSLTVSQIAPLLGFSDSSNFNRAFKRWLGISPSKYRALGFN